MLKGLFIRKAFEDRIHFRVITGRHFSVYGPKGVFGCIAAEMTVPCGPSHEFLLAAGLEPFPRETVSEDLLKRLDFTGQICPLRLPAPPPRPPLGLGFFLI